MRRRTFPTLDAACPDYKSASNALALQRDKATTHPGHLPGHLFVRSELLLPQRRNDREESKQQPAAHRTPAAVAAAAPARSSAPADEEVEGGVHRSRGQMRALLLMREAAALVSPAVGGVPIARVGHGEDFDD